MEALSVEQKLKSFEEAEAESIAKNERFADLMEERLFGSSAVDAQRHNEPANAGSNPASRSRSARTYSTSSSGARDAQREGCI